MPQSFRGCLALVLVIMAAGTRGQLFAGDAGQHRDLPVSCPIAPSGLSLLVPYYQDPNDTPTYGQDLIKYASTCRMYAIISGDNIGAPIDNLPIYTAAYLRMSSAGVGLYGYVHTLSNPDARTARPLADVKKDIDMWYTNFPGLLIGIFLDEVEQSTTNANSLTFYSAITAYLRGAHPGVSIIFNPGTEINCALAAQADIVMDQEVMLADWNDGTRACACPQAAACAVILEGVSAAQMPGLAAQAHAGGYQYAYITDLGENDPNPYIRLPLYWAQEATLVTAASPGSTSSPPPPPPRKAASPPPPPPRSSPRPAPLAAQPPSPVRKMSPPPPPPPPPTATPAPKPASSVWRPGPKTTWQWQLDGSDYSAILAQRPQMIDIDIDAYPAVVKQVAKAGIARSAIKIMCYFSLGTYEPFRAPADLKRGISWRALIAQFGASRLFLGSYAPPFAEELWLNVHDVQVRAAVVAAMRLRLKDAAAKGCDGVEMDNADASSAYPKVTVTDALAFNMAMVDSAHGLGLSAGLKNAANFIPLAFPDGRKVTAVYDWYLNEECFGTNSCSDYNAVPTNIAVFGTEYCDSIRAFQDPQNEHNPRPECFCPLALARPNFNWIYKSSPLIAPGFSCATYCATHACTAPAKGDVTKCWQDKPAQICSMYSIAYAS